MAFGLFWPLCGLSLFSAVAISDAFVCFPRKNRFPVNGRTVLIGGGSMGMGRSVARQLAEKGANVIIVARNPERLEAALAYVADGATRPSPEQRFYHISADLSIATESARVIAEATAWNGGSPPDIVWCCAGGAYPTHFLDTPVEAFRAQMDLNYFSAVYLAHAVLNAWIRGVKSSSGAPASNDADAASVTVPASRRASSPSPSPRPRELVFTASVVALYPFAGYAPYSPTKAALRCVCDTLSQEVNLYKSAIAAPVRVHTVFPGVILTEAFAEENKIKSDLAKKLEEDDAGQTPDEVARRCIAGLENGDEMVTTSWLARLLLAANLGVSRRSGFGVLDTVLGWVMGLVVLAIRWDMDSKITKWGREHGISGMREKLT